MSILNKALLACVISTVSVASFAAETGFYLKGDVGYTKVSVDDYDKSPTGMAGRIGAGYDFGYIRADVDYTYSAPKESGVFGLDLKVKQLAATAYFDFENSSKIIPYIGVGVSRNKTKLTYKQLLSSAEGEVSKTGVRAVVGAQFWSDSNVYTNFSVEYTKIADDAGQYAAFLGLGYRF